MCTKHFIQFFEWNFFFLFTRFIHLFVFIWCVFYLLLYRVIEERYREGESAMEIEKKTWMTPIRESHSMAMTFFWVSFHNSFMNYDVCCHVIALIHFFFRDWIVDFASIFLFFCSLFAFVINASTASTAAQPPTDKHLTTGNLKVTPIKITNWKLFKWVMKLHSIVRHTNLSASA